MRRGTSDRCPRAAWSPRSPPGRWPRELGDAGPAAAPAAHDLRRSGGRRAGGRRGRGAPARTVDVPCACRGAESGCDARPPDDGGVRGSRRGFAFTDLEPPVGVRPLAEARSFRDPPPPGVEPFPPDPFWAERLEGRGALGHAPWEAYTPGRAEHATWYRLDDPPVDEDGVLDPLALVVCADSMPGCRRREGRTRPPARLVRAERRPHGPPARRVPVRVGPRPQPRPVRRRRVRVARHGAVGLRWRRHRADHDWWPTPRSCASSPSRSDSGPPTSGPDRGARESGRRGAPRQVGDAAGRCRVGPRAARAWSRGRPNGGAIATPPRGPGGPGARSARGHTGGRGRALSHRVDRWPEDLRCRCWVVPPVAGPPDLRFGQRRHSRGLGAGAACQQSFRRLASDRPAAPSGRRAIDSGESVPP